MVAEIALIYNSHFLYKLIPSRIIYFGERVVMIIHGVDITLENRHPLLEHC